MLAFALVSLACFVPALSIRCQECTLVTTSTNGVASNVQNENQNCIERSCGNATKCAYGYANFIYSDEMVIMTGLDPMELNIDVKIQFFKGCHAEDYQSCSTLEASASSSTGSGNYEMTTKACDLNTCDTDNCNDIANDVINPDGAFEPIQCYVCQNSKVGGVAMQMDEEYPIATECNSTNIKTCPLGVTQCISGNAAATMSGIPFELEYNKGCGMSEMASCSGLETMLSQMDGKVSSCSVHKCSGSLCNNQTAEETSLLVGSGCHVTINFMVLCCTFMAVMTNIFG